jgi:uncharacterized protein (TIGR03000 family)
MFPRTLPWGASLLLAGAGLLVTAGSGSAQARGGGIHGPPSSFRTGGYFGGVYGNGGYRGGAYSNGGYTPGYHVGGYHFGGYLGGYRPGGYPGYTATRRSFSGVYPYTPSGYGYYSYAPGPSPGLGGTLGHVGESELSVPEEYEGTEPYYTTAHASSNAPAYITVSVPAGSRLWFEGRPVHSMGRVRQFRSPPLAPGHEYVYDIRARWRQHGRLVTQTRQVAVSSGGAIAIKFPYHPAKQHRRAAGKRASSHRPDSQRILKRHSRKDTQAARSAGVTPSR